MFKQEAEDIVNQAILGSQEEGGVDVFAACLTALEELHKAELARELFECLRAGEKVVNGMLYFDSQKVFDEIAGRNNVLRNQLENLNEGKEQ